MKDRRLMHVGQVYRCAEDRLPNCVLGAVAKMKSTAKNLGWAKAMASELQFYGSRSTAR